MTGICSQRDPAIIQWGRVSIARGSLSACRRARRQDADPSKTHRLCFEAEKKEAPAFHVAGAFQFGFPRERPA